MILENKSQSSGSTEPLKKSWDIRNEDNMSYHTREACFNPYRAFFSLYYHSETQSSRPFGRRPYSYERQTTTDFSKPRGIFINQSKYALESLKKYGFDSCDPVDTPMVEKSKLDEDKEGKAIDPSHYRGMIGTLLYLTANRPDLEFAICMCARYQARPTKKHLHAVKRIFWYLRGTVNQGLWYPKDSLIALTAFTDADHAGCQDTRRSTSGSLQFLRDRLEQVEKGVIELYFVNTEYQLADIFTKALGRERIEFLINKLGMQIFTSETLKQLVDEVEE
nr:uncharacterized mitochondrial protein AtMg00810-like [Tanacetum cinerariifolium]